MKNIKSVSLAVVLLLASASCTKNFEEIDFPATSTVTTDADGLFTVATQRGSLTWYMYDRAQRLTTNLYMQYNAITGSFATDFYEPAFSIFTDIWDRTYGDQNFEFAPVFYANHAIEVSMQRNNPHKEGIARIWRVFLFQRITDMYGDIPYSQAFKGPQPTFDRQEDIYRDFVSEIRLAKERLNQAGNFSSYGSSDLIYQGNREKWEKFANSLLLRIALRMINVDPAFSQSIITEIKDGPFLSSNADNNKMLWDGSVSNIYFRNPILVTEVFNNTRMSETMVNFLKDNNDPRLPLYVKPAETDGQYRGLKNGLNPDNQSVFDDNYFLQFSRVGPAFLEENGATYNMHYAEVCFLLAEACQRGLMTGSATTWYNEGIKAAMEMYGFNDNNAIQAYIAQPQIQLDNTRALEQIITQKWVSLCMNGIEAWAEKRRTGFPVLQPLEFQGPVNGGRFPRRLIYSESEKRLNRTNTEAAIARMGGDDQGVRVWWDVN